MGEISLRKLKMGEGGGVVAEAAQGTTFIRIPVDILVKHTN